MAKFFPYVGGAGSGGSPSGSPVPQYRLTNDAAWAESTVPGESRFVDERGATLLRIKKDGVYLQAVSSIHTETAYATEGGIPTLTREHNDPSQPVALYRLPNGRLFMYGGLVGSAASIQDGDGLWQQMEPPVRPSDIEGIRSELVEFAHGQLPDGRIIVAGGSLTSVDTGEAGYANDTLIYSEDTGWSLGPAISSHRSIGAFAVAGGRFLVFGGVEWVDAVTQTPTVKCQAFNPATDLWEDIADLPAAHGAMASAVVLSDGRVLVFGGDVVSAAHIYNPSSDAWVACSADPEFGTYEWTRFSMVEKAGKVYVAGGTLEAGEAFVGYSQVVRVYDPATDAWTGMPNLNLGRRRGMLLSRGDALAYIGGFGVDNALTAPTMELYDSKQNIWVMGDLPFESAAGSFLVEGDGTVIQGGTAGATELLKFTSLAVNEAGFPMLFPEGPASVITGTIPDASEGRPAAVRIYPAYVGAAAEGPSRILRVCRSSEDVPAFEVSKYGVAAYADQRVDTGYRAALNLANLATSVDPEVPESTSYGIDFWGTKNFLQADALPVSRIALHPVAIPGGDFRYDLAFSAGRALGIEPCFRASTIDDSKSLLVEDDADLRWANYEPGTGELERTTVRLSAFDTTSPRSTYVGVGGEQGFGIWCGHTDLAGERQFDAEPTLSLVSGAAVVHTDKFSLDGGALILKKRGAQLPYYTRDLSDSNNALDGEIWYTGDLLKFKSNHNGSGDTTEILATREWVNQAMTTPTVMNQTEVLLTTGAASLFSPAANRKRMEIYNAGPNPIKVGPASNKMLRILQNKEAWVVDFVGDVYMQATVANQITGAATVVTELV